MAVTEKAIYILRGDRLYRVNPTTLEVEKEGKLPEVPRLRMAPPPGAEREEPR